MNSSQKNFLGIAAGSLLLVLLFPPFDQFSIANFKVPVFGGFHFYFTPPQYSIVNTSMLLLEVFVVFINVGIGWLLLQDKAGAGPPGRGPGYQNAVLLFAAVNLVVIVLFPPFESVFAVANAALPTFEGFYFLFGRQPNHVIVTTLLYIEVIFVLVNCALAWLIFRQAPAAALTSAQAQALAAQLRRG